MKKYLSLVMIGLSLMLSGCNKDDNNDPDTPPTGDTGKVRYEATVSDPENFKLLIHYTVGVDISSEAPEEAAKETIVESPFTFEQEAKQGTYLWLSAYPIPKDEENLENLQLPKTVEVKIFIDDKLHKPHSFLSSVPDSYRPAQIPYSWQRCKSMRIYLKHRFGRMRPLRHGQRQKCRVFPT